MTREQTKSGPKYRLAFAREVPHGRDGETKTRWVDIGAAFDMGEGRLRLVIESLPVDMGNRSALEIVAFPPREDNRGGRR